MEGVTMKRLSHGHTAEELEPAVREKYIKDFTGPMDSFIKVYPGGWVLPTAYIKFEEKLFTFKFRPDDVLVMTYPKCGTTWMQEIVWTMRNNPDLDNPDAAETLYTRSPFIDADMMLDGPFLEGDCDFLKNNPFCEGFFKLCPGKDVKDGSMLQLSEVLPSPRTLKTHLPFSLLNRSLIDTCKVVYVARNPKDMILSYLHHCRLLKGHGFVGSQDAFIDYFVDNMVVNCPYGEHLKEAWQLRHHPNLLWVFYEDLKKDTLGQLRRLDAFMGTELTEGQLLNVKEHTSFNKMQANDPTKFEVIMDKQIKEKDGGFIRKGQAGSWKGKYTAEQERKIDDWIKKNFEGHGLQFEYE